VFERGDVGVGEIRDESPFAKVASARL
jgi:hypothetical protein